MFLATNLTMFLATINYVKNQLKTHYPHWLSFIIQASSIIDFI
jgi:hypothetical protein